MQIPAAMFIESAVDSLKNVDVKKLCEQDKELEEAVGIKSSDYINGYRLGLQVARTILATSNVLQMNNIDSDKLL